MKTVWNGEDIALRLPTGIRAPSGIGDRLAPAVFSRAARDYMILDHVRWPDFEARCWQDPAVEPEYLEDRLWERATARRPVAMPPRRVLL